LPPHVVPEVHSSGTQGGTLCDRVETDDLAAKIPRTGGRQTTLIFLGL
jgi:hypothetical protein